MIKYRFHKQYSLYYQEGMELYHHNDGRLYTLFKIYASGGASSCPDTLLPHIAEFVTIKNVTFKDIDFLFNNSIINMGQVFELKKKLEEIINSKIMSQPFQKNTNDFYELNEPTHLDCITGDVKKEVERAIKKYPAMHSPHEGYAILLEEVDELWELVKIKQSLHDKVKMKEEAVQIAAMAIRFIHDLT